MIINKNKFEENYMQGISIFDGKWDGLTVVNNVVVTNTWHGIALYGVNNALVVNNTVVPSSPRNLLLGLLSMIRKDKTPRRM